MARDTTQKSYKVSTAFGKETRFKGSLSFQDSLRIDGYFEGRIESSGFLVVGSEATVIADITTGMLVVSGTVKGNVKTDHKIEILSGGQIIGNIRCPDLVVYDDTSVQGYCEMLSDPESVDIFSMPVDRLKKTLERVE